MEPMKFKDDPWLTDYFNAVHFAVRWIETRTRDRTALYRLKTEVDALIREAILGNLPMEVMTIRRMARRIHAAETRLVQIDFPEPDAAAGPALQTYAGDTRGLVEDYHVIRDGYEEFTLKGLTEECGYYFPKVYPDMADLAATVTELFQRDIAAGEVEMIRSGVYRLA